jgi:hypothetical protein
MATRLVLRFGDLAGTNDESLNDQIQHATLLCGYSGGPWRERFLIRLIRPTRHNILQSCRHDCRIKIALPRRVR